jgi:hypothetical protein
MQPSKASTCALQAGASWQQTQSILHDAHHWACTANILYAAYLQDPSADAIAHASEPVAHVLKHVINPCQLPVALRDKL